MKGLAIGAPYERRAPARQRRGHLRARAPRRSEPRVLVGRVRRAVRRTLRRALAGRAERSEHQPRGGETERERCREAPAFDIGARPATSTVQVRALERPPRRAVAVRVRSPAARQPATQEARRARHRGRDRCSARRPASAVRARRSCVRPLVTDEGPGRKDRRRRQHERRHPQRRRHRQPDPRRPHFFHLIGPRTSDLGVRTSDVGRRASEFGRRTSDVGHRLSNIEYRASDTIAKIGMPTKSTTAERPRAAAEPWRLALVCALAWLVPGAGHLMQGRARRDSCSWSRCR